jgi:polyhydroxyalkanoate synthesis regulator phasin
MVYDVVRKAVLASLGVQEKMKDFVDDLIKKGELNEHEGAKLMKEWMTKAKTSTEDVNRMAIDGMRVALDKMNIATKEELDSLTKKVQQLSVRLKKLESEIKTGQEAH